MFKKGDRVRVTSKISDAKRYNRLVDGDEGNVVFVVGNCLIALVMWDKGFRSNVNWGEVDVIK